MDLFYAPIKGAPTAVTIFSPCGGTLGCTYRQYYFSCDRTATKLDGEIIDQSRIEIYDKIQLLKSDALVGTMNVTKSATNNQTAAHT